jgi:CRP/FNR family cyclic AMP-dependent transcriptional regulator
MGGFRMIVSGILRKNLFFAGLGDEELESLSAIACEISFQSGDLIFDEGDSAHMLYLLLDGWVDIVVEINDHQDSRRQLVVTTLSSGNMFGWSAVVEPYVYTTSAVCASPVKAIGFSKIDLQSLFETNQRLYYVIITRICQIIASRLHTTRLQMASMFVMD